MFFKKRQINNKTNNFKKDKLSDNIKEDDNIKWKQIALLKEKENQLLIEKLEKKEQLINEKLEAFNNKINDNLKLLENYDESYLNKYHNEKIINKLTNNNNLKDTTKILDLLSSFSLNTLYYQEHAKDITISNLALLQSYELSKIIEQNNKTNKINVFLFKFLTLTQLLNSSIYINNNPQFYLHATDLNKIKHGKDINLKYLSSFNENNPILYKLEIFKKDNNSITYKNAKQFEVNLTDEIISQYVYKAFIIYFAINKEVEKLWLNYNNIINQDNINQVLFDKLNEYIDILSEDSALIIDDLYFIELTQNYRNYLDFNRLSNSHYFHNN